MRESLFSSFALEEAVSAAESPTLACLPGSRLRSYLLETGSAIPIKRSNRLHCSRRETNASGWTAKPLRGREQRGQGRVMEEIQMKSAGRRLEWYHVSVQRFDSQSRALETAGNYHLHRIV